jgi:hypothetical protein
MPKKMKGVFREDVMVPRNSSFNPKINLSQRISALVFVFFSMSFLLIIGWLSLISTAQPTRAQGNPFGSFTHTLTTDFGAVCSTLADTVVSDANGGEIRLAASVEDYFNAPQVNSSLWLTDTVYSWYSVPQFITNGIITLDSNFLRSQESFSQTVRFFEARANLLPGSGTSGRPDLGFYRELPPLDPNAITNTSSIRLFVYGISVPNDLIVRSRDGGDSVPLIDTNIDDPDLTQYQVFRIEWDNSETRYYINNVLQETHTPSSLALDSWIFLYHQTPTNSPSDPLYVDWVRAGAYPASGTYTSCDLDAGQQVIWNAIDADLLTPSGTAVNFETRTSENGTTWSDWVSPVQGVISSPMGRYLQYRAELSTSNVMESPEIQEVRVNYGDYSPTIFDYGIEAGEVGSPRWNAIAVPLEVGAITADGVASFIDPGGSISQVGRWDPASQSWVFRVVGSPFPPASYPVNTGDPLLVLANESAPLSFTWTGDVPNPGSISYSLSQNQWHFVMLPLDQDPAVSTADALATAIQAGASTSGMQIGSWDASSQSWVFRVVGSPFPPANYAVDLGYPYLVLTNASTPTQWP